jgi:hypothetical protein
VKSWFDPQSLPLCLGVPCQVSAPITVNQFPSINITEKKGGEQIHVFAEHLLSLVGLASPGVNTTP